MPLNFSSINITLRKKPFTSNFYLSESHIYNRYPAAAEAEVKNMEEGVGDAHNLLQEHEYQVAG